MRAKSTNKRRATAMAGFVLLGLMGEPTHAQEANAPGQNAYTDLSQYLVGNGPQQALPAASTATLSSTVTQIGQGNNANAILSGTSNLTSQYQAGWQNYSTLSINGTQNSIATTQIGNSNTTAIDISGNSNTVSNLQVGSGLSYHLQVVGTSAPVSVQQFGRK